MFPRFCYRWYCVISWVEEAVTAMQNLPFLIEIWVAWRYWLSHFKCLLFSCYGPWG